MVKKEFSPIRAWRLYWGAITQRDGSRLPDNSGDDSGIENGQKGQKAERCKKCRRIGNPAELLD